MYFAVQSMAAEFSTAILLVDEIRKTGKKPSMIIVSMKADFISRARDRTVFTCLKPSGMQQKIEKAISSDEAQVIDMVSTGRSEGWDKVSEFHFQWSVKRRKEKP